MCGAVRVSRFRVHKLAAKQLEIEKYKIANVDSTRLARVCGAPRACSSVVAVGIRCGIVNLICVTVVESFLTVIVVQCPRPTGTHAMKHGLRHGVLALSLCVWGAAAAPISPEVALARLELKEAEDADRLVQERGGQRPLDSIRGSVSSDFGIYFSDDNRHVDGSYGTASRKYHRQVNAGRQWKQATANKLAAKTGSTSNAAVQVDAGGEVGVGTRLATATAKKPQKDWARLPTDFYRSFIDGMIVPCIDIILRDRTAEGVEKLETAETNGIAQNATGAGADAGTSRNKIFLIHRANKPGKDWWWWPGGRIFKGETLFLSAARKVYEDLLGLDLDLKLDLKQEAQASSTDQDAAGFLEDDFAAAGSGTRMHDRLSRSLDGVGVGWFFQPVSVVGVYNTLFADSAWRDSSAETDADADSSAKTEAADGSLPTHTLNVVVYGELRDRPNSNPATLPSNSSSTASIFQMDDLHHGHKWVSVGEILRTGADGAAADPDGDPSARNGQEYDPYIKRPLLQYLEQTVTGGEDRPHRRKVGGKTGGRCKNKEAEARKAAVRKQLEKLSGQIADLQIQRSQAEQQLLDDVGTCVAD